jgi:hypothetical protein
MRSVTIAVSLAATLAACGPLTIQPDTARLPAGVFGSSDQDVPATQYAENAFADAARTYGDPAAGAQAVLAMDYIAGQLNTSPRWANIPSDIKLELLDAREQTRSTLGIAPNAPSQLVVDSLVVARNDLAAGNKDAAIVALSNPAFPAGGAQTVERLANLPYIRMANLSTSHAAAALDSQTIRPDAFSE